ncbi:MAG: hypothetical protein ACAH11_13670 [Sphingomonas sp.]|nr:hypothetical protein [Sphingomonas sp.]
MIVAALLLTAIHGAPAPDPLAPARKGMVQCRGPREGKLCAAIVSYTLQPDGSYNSLTRFMLSEDPEIVVESPATVRVENGLVCDHNFHLKGIGSRLIYEGQTVSKGSKLSISVHEQMDPGYAQYEGKLVCGRYEAKGDVMRSTILIDGVPEAESETEAAMDGSFIWVQPEGYRLAPPPGSTSSKKKHSPR